jgi:membrane protein YqaA with SNARE-associated domain
MLARDRSVAYVLSVAPLLGFLWGFAEGTVFFILPDVLLSFVALFSFRRFVVSTGITWLGSLMASILVYYTAEYNPEMTRAIVHAVPFVTQKMFVTVQSGYEQHGAWILAKAPMSGIPYKVYAFAAPQYVDVLSFVLVGMFARLGRFLTIGLSAFLIGWLTRRKKDAPRRLLYGHLICWLILYTGYWIQVSQP